MNISLMLVVLLAAVEDQMTLPTQNTSITEVVAFGPYCR
jgi:hypothetical protein